MIEFVWELVVWIDGDTVSDGTLFLSLEGAQNRAQNHANEPNPHHLKWVEHEGGFTASFDSTRYEIHPVEVFP
jgi:hypothetical protein